MTTKAQYESTPRWLLAIYWMSTFVVIGMMTTVLAQDSYGLWMRASLLVFTFLALWICASVLKESSSVKSYERLPDEVGE